MDLFLMIIGTGIALTGWGLLIYANLKWPSDLELRLKLIAIGLLGNLIQILSIIL